MPKARPSPPRAWWPEKSYKNLEFLTSSEGRLIRILSEFIEPRARFRKYGVFNTVVFFGSARTLSRKGALRNLREVEAPAAGQRSHSADLAARLERAKRDLKMSRYYEEALLLAEKLTRWSLGIPDQRKRFYVCSGGGDGIMAAANRGAKRAGGESIGLNISLPREQTPNHFQSRALAFDFHYFFVRKFWFFYLAKALVAFPGGFGTMDEVFELLTLVQTRKTRKYMPIVLYGSEYWGRVLNFEALVEAGTVDAADLKIFRTVDDVDSAFEFLKKELTEHYLKGPPPREITL